MLGFLTPTWLFGLGALTVPIALHLWSRRGGTPIRVGSIRLLVGAPPATRRAWRIQDPWLLALRCSILAALVLALAGPYWLPPAGGRPWALVSGDARRDTGLLDSLRRAGLKIHPLNGSDFWTALRDLDRAAPPGTPFVVFAPDLLRYFRGARPAIHAAVEWRVRPPPPASVTPPPIQPDARLVAIYADPARSDDARYFSAAIRAAAAATGIPAVVTLRSPSLDPVADAEWIAWLSARPVPDPLLRRVRAGATLLSDAGNDTASDRRTTIVFASAATVRPPNRPTAPLLIRRSSTTDSGAPLWADGAGAPLLTVTREGGGRGLHYRFHSRFHPSWGELVLRPEFPEALVALWTAALPAGPTTGVDDRRLTVSQLLPARDSTPGPVTPETERMSLFLPFWLLSVVLFGVERWLVTHPRGRPA